MGMNGLSVFKGFGKARGFSLVELVVVIAIMAIVVVLAYPSILAWLQAAESRKVESTFKSMLRQAKAEVSVTRRDIIICTLNEQSVCDRAGSGVLVMFYDENGNNKKETNEQALYQQDWHLKHGRILLRTSAARHYIEYKGDTAKPRGHIGHLQYCSVSDNQRLSFKVIVNMQGQVRVERGDLVKVC